MRRLLDKIHRRLIRMRLQPMRVFCFHQVSDEYEPMYGGIENWTETEHFKQHILALKKKYKFISISDALSHLKNDTFRNKHYAVLTCDDGYQCVLKLLPWLEQQQVPITLFINVQYLDGVSYDPWFDNHWKEVPFVKKRSLLQNMYIHWNHLQTELLFSENVTLAMHGMGHDDVSGMGKEAFILYIDQCVDLLGRHARFKPFFAYPWGRHSSYNDKVLKKKGIIPVYCDGKSNYRFDGAIHREWIDGEKFEEQDEF